MTLPELSIKRPVLATVFSIVLVLFGIIGFVSTGVRDYPSVDPPIITVTTNYVGANSDVMISQITEPLEESINGIDGIKNITSTSSDGRSSIRVEFGLDIDLEAAANDVRDRVSRAQRNLPPNADPPTVVKSDADATTILSLTVQSPERSLLELSEIGNNVFKERLQTIEGISEIRIWGEKKYAMRLSMDPPKMASLGISPMDIRTALAQQNVELPTGRVDGETTELSIRTMGRLQTEEEFNDMIIRESENEIIRFKDVGRAVLGAEQERTLLRGNGAIPMIGIAVTPQPGSNYVAVADEFYKRVDQLRDEIPDDLQLGYALDATTSIRKAISEVQETILIAFLLVVLVIFVFLRSGRSLLIPVIAIPISLISAFFIMYLADFSINILTLLGIALSTGLVVDDAIVVLENIYQKVEEGIPPRKAAFLGSKEIFFAVISTTITLVAVFLPIVFLEGITGRLFREFGVVVAGSVVISSFVSLTLTPMMSSRILKKGSNDNAFYRSTERFFDSMALKYKNGLRKFMTYRWVAIVIMAVSIAIIFLVGSQLQSELAPIEDKSRFNINATAPEGTSFNAMNDYIRGIIDRAEELPETESVLAVTAPGFRAGSSSNSGFVRVTLTQPETRQRSQMQIVDSLTRVFSSEVGAQIYISQEPTIGDRRGGLPVQFVVQAVNFEKLKEAVPKFNEMAQANPAFSVVDINLKFNKPELSIDIDRSRAQVLGVSVLDVAEILQLYFSDQRMGFFIKDGRQYQVIGQASSGNANEPGDIRSLYVPNNNGELIQLDNIVTISERTSPPQLFRYNRYVSATFSANTAEGVSLAEGIEAMQSIADEVLDETYSTELSGASKDFAESSNTLLFAFLLALVLVYLTLSGQFESFLDPLIIMFTVPLALAGAILALWLTGSTLNIFSQIGIIVLIGIVTKNGILIVEFANQRKDAGLGTLKAVLEASASRFRPILMTSLATMLGALPIALALGASSVSRVSMGIVIIGGLLFSLVLTLFVIPALYTFMSRDKTVYDD